MAVDIHGRMGASALAAATDTSLYTVPAARKATVTVSLTNRSATSSTIRLAHVPGAIGTVVNADYIEYDVTLPGNSTLERTGITMTATHTILARALNATVSAVCWGIETDV